MALSMHDVCVPIFNRMLGNLSGWLDRAVADAQARKYDESALLQARLAPDMLPLLRQVQIACDTVKFAVGRLAGGEMPVFPDDETTIAALKARIAATLAYVASVPAAAFEGSETKAITVPARGRASLEFNGADYLREFALPNFYFHVTTTYALLRHNGVLLGKADYLRGGA